MTIPNTQSVFNYTSGMKMLTPVNTNKLTLLIFIIFIHIFSTIFFTSHVSNNGKHINNIPTECKTVLVLNLKSV